jgi:hypothetical protein
VQRDEIADGHGVAGALEALFFGLSLGSVLVLADTAKRPSEAEFSSAPSSRPC